MRTVPGGRKGELKGLTDYGTDAVLLHQKELIALGSDGPPSMPPAPKILVFYSSLVDQLLLKRLLGGFWMVQVKQKPAEISQNEWGKCEKC